MSVSQLRIASFNAENFYLLLDRACTRETLEALDEQTYRAMNSSIYNENKSRAKIAEIARIIRENDFDVVGMCEVGGLQTLETFNHLYLDDVYDCYLFEENSKRGIFVGALLRKGCFPDARVTSMPGDFSRNLVRIDLGEAWGSAEVFVVHLKSQYGDDRGIQKRVEEIKTLCSFLRTKKCIVMGDFNGILIRGMHQFEYEEFLKLPFCDVLAAVGIPPELRHTHYYFGNGKKFSQLDYIFCTHDIEILAGGTIEDEIPQTRQEKNNLPSDHLFIYAAVALDRCHDISY
jgi:endonuclease/exonuclease/phosphatase family metal-dependent hydrolase